MKVYQGISGGIYHVADKRLGRGGEGSVHEIENFRGMLLRFSRRISEMQQEKKNFVRWCKTQFLKKCLSV